MVLQMIPEQSHESWWYNEFVYSKSHITCLTSLGLNHKMWSNILISLQAYCGIQMGLYDIPHNCFKNIWCTTHTNNSTRCTIVQARCARMVPINPCLLACLVDWKEPQLGLHSTGILRSILAFYFHNFLASMVFLSCVFDHLISDFFFLHQVSQLGSWTFLQSRSQVSNNLRIHNSWKLG